ncbi:MAG: helix-turn-helix transcriptional regulator [Gaiellaceae bacterium]
MTYRTKAEIGRYLAELRTERGFSQRELAERVGIDKSAMSRVEAGARGLAVDELTAAAEFFGKTVDEILRKDEVAFAFRAEADDATVQEAIDIFNKVFDDFFALKTAAN